MKTENKIYVVVRIGCIECGTPSSVIGSFETKEEAEKFSNANPWDSWAEHGGDGFQSIFETTLTVKKRKL